MAEFDSEASLSPKSTGEVRVEFGVGFSLPNSLLSGPSRIHVLHGCSTGVPMISHVLRPRRRNRDLLNALPAFVTAFCVGFCNVSPVLVVRLLSAPRRPSRTSSTASCFRGLC